MAAGGAGPAASTFQAECTSPLLLPPPLVYTLDLDLGAPLVRGSSRGVAAASCSSEFKGRERKRGRLVGGFAFT